MGCPWTYEAGGNIGILHPRTAYALRSKALYDMACESGIVEKAHQQHHTGAEKWHVGQGGLEDIPLIDDYGQPLPRSCLAVRSCCQWCRLVEQLNC
eukprot:6024218-Amphidinium_carterae.1